jgi:hypothetical protein
VLLAFITYPTLLTPSPSNFTDLQPASLPACSNRPRRRRDPDPREGGGLLCGPVLIHYYPQEASLAFIADSAGTSGLLRVKICLRPQKSMKLTYNQLIKLDNVQQPSKPPAASPRVHFRHLWPHSSQI